jgi:hypothetical protein
MIYYYLKALLDPEIRECLVILILIELLLILGSIGCYYFGKAV